MPPLEELLLLTEACSAEAEGCAELLLLPPRPAMPPPALPLLTEGLPEPLGGALVLAQPDGPTEAEAGTELLWDWLAEREALPEAELTPEAAALLLPAED